MYHAGWPARIKTAGIPFFHGIPAGLFRRRLLVVVAVAVLAAVLAVVFVAVLAVVLVAVLIVVLLVIGIILRLIVGHDITPPVNMIKLQPYYGAGGRNYSPSFFQKHFSSPS